MAEPIVLTLDHGEYLWLLDMVKQEKFTGSAGYRAAVADFEEKLLALYPTEGAQE